ncbi:hypothetical protein M2447_000072 [Ereboglobus sp. PH5-10]|uniref:hypothetical protein n=1 Tax=Ereboglobus sp. PH5-10 TaxID=2940629 RepID=UPI0024072BBA|nr:hypothetical protein [Ereboglobus sp. PH5-10]MDF9825996.1 hypothetical protein [Ereboglobus sp. PH5-10]
MVIPNDNPPSAPAAASRLDGNIRARLWHFRLMRASLSPVAFTARRATVRTHSQHAMGAHAAAPSNDVRLGNETRHAA